MKLRHEHVFERMTCEMPECVGHLMCKCGELSETANIQKESFGFRIESLEVLRKDLEQKLADTIKTIEYNKDHLKAWIKNI